MPRPRGSRLEPFPRVRSVSQQGAGTLWLLEDDRGTLLYRTGPQPIVWRFYRRSAEGVRAVPAPQGPPVPLLHLRRADGRPVLVRAGPDHILEMEFLPELWADGWILAAHPALFFRPVPGAVEVAVPVSYDDRDPVPVRHRRVATGGARPVGREGTLLHFEGPGGPRALSLRDVAVAAPMQAGGPAPEELWLAPLPGSPRPARRPRPADASVAVAFPRPEERVPEWERVPSALCQALLQEGGGGDHLSDYRVPRDETGTWWGLRDDVLLRYAGGRAEEVGRLPVTLRRGGTLEGLVGYTVGALVRRGGAWYVADTFGDRVLKLDEELRVVAERAMPGPFAVEVLDDGTVRVDGLSGRVRLDPELRPLTDEPAPWRDAPAAATLEVRPGSFLEDPVTGLRWLYHDAYLYAHDRAAGRWRRGYVGPPRRLEAGVDLALRGDRILVLFDDRILVFGRDGRWQRTVALPYPEGELWECTPAAPSRHVDPAGTQALLVQGCRLVAADLETGRTRLLFHQLQAQLGPLAVHGGTAYLSLRHGPYGDEEAFAELVAVDPAGRVRRWWAPGPFVLEGVTEGGELVLWAHSQPRSPDGTGREWRVPAARLGIEAAASARVGVRRGRARGRPSPGRRVRARAGGRPRSGSPAPAGRPVPARAPTPRA